MVLSIITFLSRVGDYGIWNLVDSDVNNSCFDLNGYCLVGKNPATRSGGVCICIRTGIKCTNVEC